MSDRMRFELAEFKGRSYSFGMLNVIESALLLVQLKGVAKETLLSVGGMDLSDIATAVRGVGDGLDLKDASKLTSVAGALIGAIGEDVWIKASTKMMGSRTKLGLVKMANANGEYKSVNIIEDFNGRTMEYMVVILLALRHNYADFFDGLLSKLNGAKEQTKTDG